MLDLIDIPGVVKAPDHLALANPKLDERQLIESVNDTLKGHLDLELHGGRTIDGLTARIAPRVPAVTAATAYGITLRGPKTPPPGITRRWLRQQYVRRSRSSVDLATQLGLHHNTILCWCQRYDLPVRALGRTGTAARSARPRRSRPSCGRS